MNARISKVARMVSLVGAVVAAMALSACGEDKVVAQAAPVAQVTTTAQAASVAPKVEAPKVAPKVEEVDPQVQEFVQLTPETLHIKIGFGLMFLQGAKEHGAPASDIKEGEAYLKALYAAQKMQEANPELVQQAIEKKAAAEAAKEAAQEAERAQRDYLRAAEQEANRINQETMRQIQAEKDAAGMAS